MSKSKFDPYEILKASKTDDIHAIEKKFKKLAVKWHPDKNQSSEAKEMYLNISKAKDILTNPDKRSKYDKYGITDESDEMAMQETMAREMMMKQQLKEVMKMQVSIEEVLNGFTKSIKINRSIINSRTRQQTAEQLDVKIEYDSTMPVNKPLKFDGFGKKYDDNVGDLFIILDIIPNSTYKINKSNYNLINTQKISLAQSICGFEIKLSHSKTPIIIQHNGIIKHDTIYTIKNMGLKISDDDNLITSDIEINFDINYNVSKETIEKLKEAFNYEYTKCETKNIYKLTESKKQQLKINDHEQGVSIEDILGGGIPGLGGFPGGIPGMGGFPGGIPGMRTTHTTFRTTGGGGQQDCHMQ
jgi:DnaJ-class molecular chaperone